MCSLARICSPTGMSSVTLECVLWYATADMNAGRTARSGLYSESVFSH